MLLSAAVLASSLLAEIIPRISAPLIQIALGVLIAVLAPAPISIDISPEVFLLLFIAPLLYDEAKRTDRTALFKNRYHVLALAVGLVVAIMLIVGVSLHSLFPAVPLAAALALGAALGPTDAVAVNSLKREVKLTRRENSLLNGECLLNDASGVVAFQFAIAAVVTGFYSWQTALLDFAFEFFGGIVLGIVFAVLLHYVQQKVRNMGLESLTFFSLIDIMTPFALYIISELLGVSGILGVVACGLTVSSFADTRIGPTISQLNIHQANVWKVLSFALNGMVFVILGIELPLAVTYSWEQPFINNYTLVGLVLAITAVIVIVRFVWIVGMERLHRHPITGKRSRLSKRRILSCLALTIGGPKGAVTLSIIMSIPYMVGDGEPFPERALIIFIASGVILCTLLLANFVLPLVSPTPKKNEVTIEFEEAAPLRIDILREVIQQLSVEQKESNAAATRTVISMYNDRIQRIASESDSIDDTNLDDVKRGLEVEIIQHQERYLLHLFETDRIETAEAYRLSSLLSQREQILTHHSSRRWMLVGLVRRVLGSGRFIRSTIVNLLPGVDESKRDAAIRRARILLERETVHYLDQKITSGESKYPPELLAEAAADHTNLLHTYKNAGPSLIYLNETLDDTDDIMRRALLLELEQIQSLYDEDKISRGLMRRLRENVYLMQLDLENRI